MTPSSERACVRQLWSQGVVRGSEQLSTRSARDADHNTRLRVKYDDTSIPSRKAERSEGSAWREVRRKRGDLTMEAMAC